MPSYHVNSTGSARSVGVRRIKKTYIFADGTKVSNRSQAGARRAAGKLEEAPIVLGATVFNPVTGTGGGTGTGTGGGTIAPSAVTINVTGANSQNAVIDFGLGGKTLSADATISFTVVITGGVMDTFDVDVTQGSTGHQIAQAVAAAADWGTENVTPTVVGSEVRLDAGAGKTFSVLTASIA